MMFSRMESLELINISNTIVMALLCKSDTLGLITCISIRVRRADIFRQLIITYSLNAVFKWPQEIKDLESLNRLYLTVFQNLNEISSELVRYVPFNIQDEHKRVEYLQEGLKYTFEDAKMYVKMIPEFDEFNVGSEFDTVMSNLFTAFKMHITWKDYRSGLNEYKSEYPS